MAPSRCRHCQWWCPCGLCRWHSGAATAALVVVVAAAVVGCGGCGATSSAIATVVVVVVVSSATVGAGGGGGAPSLPSSLLLAAVASRLPVIRDVRTLPTLKAEAVTPYCAESGQPALLVARSQE